jgi:hypothetical protein
MGGSGKNGRFDLYLKSNVDCVVRIPGRGVGAKAGGPVRKSIQWYR